MVGWASVHSHTAAEQPHHIRNKRDKINNTHTTLTSQTLQSMLHILFWGTIGTFDLIEILFVVTMMWMPNCHGKIAYKLHTSFNPQYPHCFASRYMVLSCMMLLHSVIAFILQFGYSKWLQGLRADQADIVCLPSNRKPPDPALKGALPRRRHNHGTNASKPDSFRGVSRLALLAALSRSNWVPDLDLASNITLRKHLRKYRNRGGILDTNKLAVKSPHLMNKLQLYLNHRTQDKAILEGMFHLIVDTGCSVTCTPCQQDFVSIKELTKPIQLDGVGGNITVRQAGTARFETINDKGQISTIETFAY